MFGNHFQLFKNFKIDKMYSLFEFFKTTFNESYDKTQSYNDVIFSHDLSSQISDKILDHYLNHIKKHNSIVDDVCPYKILAWYGYLLAEHVYFSNKSLAVKIIATSIACMQIILEKNDVYLDKRHLLGVLRMTLMDISISKRTTVKLKNGNDKLSLGMNGFYMVFKTASLFGKE